MKFRLNCSVSRWYTPLLNPIAPTRRRRRVLLPLWGSPVYRLYGAARAMEVRSMPLLCATSRVRSESLFMLSVTLGLLNGNSQTSTYPDLSSAISGTNF
jgi:hypothetical protein